MVLFIFFSYPEQDDNNKAVFKIFLQNSVILRLWRYLIPVKPMIKARVMNDFGFRKYPLVLVYAYIMCVLESLQLWECNTTI